MYLAECGGEKGCEGASACHSTQEESFGSLLGRVFEQYHGFYNDIHSIFIMIFIVYLSWYIYNDTVFLVYL